VLLAVPLERAPLLRELRELLSELPIDVHLVPDTADFVPLHPTVSDLDGLPIVTIRRAPAVGPSAFLKRGVDIVGATTGLVVLAPVLGIISFIIRWIEGGPVLYRQERVGWGGRPFTRLVADLEYVRRWSLGLDLKILALTVVRGFVHENAF
jgi:lipopolysaccharide/colanic/teichoic acid biosynthesis glycosyltransferase